MFKVWIVQVGSNNHLTQNLQKVCMAMIEETTVILTIIQRILSNLFESLPWIHALQSAVSRKPVVCYSVS